MSRTKTDNEAHSQDKRCLQEADVAVWGDSSSFMTTDDDRRTAQGLQSYDTTRAN